MFQHCLGMLGGMTSLAPSDGFCTSPRGWYDATVPGICYAMLVPHSPFCVEHKSVPGKQQASLDVQLKEVTQGTVE